MRAQSWIDIGRDVVHKELNDHMNTATGLGLLICGILQKWDHCGKRRVGRNLILRQ